MKLFIAILLGVLLMRNIEAAMPMPPTVTVYEFKGSHDASRYGEQMTALVTANLSTETNLVMVERVQLTTALREQAFGISGMVNSDAAAQIGMLTGAKVLVSGSVMLSGKKHLVVLANIVGTETGRLFATKVEGSADNLSELSDAISAKIVETINKQATNLIAPAAESRAERLDRVIKNLSGTNRPSVSVTTYIWFSGKKHQSSAAEGAFGAVLLKAGFPVVDGKGERKPDIEIMGQGDVHPGPRHGDLQSYRIVLDVKVQDRRTGQILMLDRQEMTSMDAAGMGYEKALQAQAAEALAERILPVLAKDPK